MPYKCFTPLLYLHSGSIHSLIQSNHLSSPLSFWFSHYLLCSLLLQSIVVSWKVAFTGKSCLPKSRSPYVHHKAPRSPQAPDLLQAHRKLPVTPVHPNSPQASHVHITSFTHVHSQVHLKQVHRKSTITTRPHSSPQASQSQASHIYLHVHYIITSL